MHGAGVDQSTGQEGDDADRADALLCDLPPRGQRHPLHSHSYNRILLCRVVLLVSLSASPSLSHSLILLFSHSLILLVPTNIHECMSVPQVSLSASALEPFTEELVKRRTASRTDELALAFALAMMDFMRWDLNRASEAKRVGGGTSSSSGSSSSGNSDGSDNSSSASSMDAVNWYQYPPFIATMLLHPTSWSAWR